VIRLGEVLEHDLAVPLPRSWSGDHDTVTEFVPLHEMTLLDSFLAVDAAKLACGCTRLVRGPVSHSSRAAPTLRKHYEHS